MALPFWLSRSPSDDDVPVPLGAGRSRASKSHQVSAGTSSTDATDADRALVACIRGGDRNAFAAMYTQHLQLLIAFAYGYVQSELVAQDIVADLFIHLWETRREWDPRHGVRAYLLTAVRHRALNAARDMARARTVLRDAAIQGISVATGESEVPADVAVERSQRRARVREAIDRLSPDRRRAMLLRWHFGLSATEIANAMGIPRAAVDQLISRGLKALREMVRE